MNPKLTKTLPEIVIEPERPPFLDPIAETLQPYIIALGIALILIAAAWAITPQLRQRNNNWLPLAGIGVTTLLAGAFVI